MRRIIAEDPDWSLAQVPYLSKLCLQTIMKNIGALPIYDQLSPTEQMFLQEKLPLTAPLTVTANLIPDGVYWQRRCNELWDLCDVLDYGKSWKRMFFERYLEGLIELFIPGASEPRSVLAMVPLCKNYVQRLNITQLLPPIKEAPREEEEERFDLNSPEDDDRPTLDRFNFSILLEKLVRLEEVHLKYTVKQCGMNFERGMFEMTRKDCETLAQALKSCKTLKVLHLYLSVVNDGQCRLLVKNLLDHPSLTELDFSFNVISDRGARAISKLLSRSKLQILNLYGNNIGDHGAKAIAHALSTNSTLEHLSLGGNCVGDEGGQYLANALLKNTCLKTLDLRGNDVAEQTARAVSNLLIHNSTLTHIRLVNTKLGVEGGKALREAMSQNTSVTELDVTLTGMEEKDVDLINEMLWANEERPRLRQQQGDSVE
uniref:T-complex-associated-testis-expressed 1 n=1 Tax=Neogobius melanostomus TaxID=47308 RepID=A0A8C6V5I7_9GOBI